MSIMKAAWASVHNPNKEYCISVAALGVALTVVTAVSPKLGTSLTKRAAAHLANPRTSNPSPR